MTAAPHVPPGPSGIPAQLPPIRKSVRVPATPERAFARFTAEMSAWWPLGSHSLGQQDAESVGFEPRVGGRIVERIRGGREAVWGTVTAWEPPHRVAFTWHPGHSAGVAQDVEVRFVADGDGTRVELEHRGFERLGKDAKKARRAYPMGWDYVLGRFAGRKSLYQGFLWALTETLMFFVRLFRRSPATAD